MGMLLFVTGCSSDDSGDSEPVAPDASPQDFVFEKKENKTAALVAYTGRALSVDIPSKVDDCLVTSIGKTDGSGNPVFKNHTEISGINIPQSIHYIGTESFRNTGGYGLGLPIARTIAHAHHGTLTVTSKYGEWAEFSLRLPK